MESPEPGPFLGLILQWNVEEKESEGRDWRAQMAAIRKTPMGPVDSTFAERALVNSEIAKVK